MHQSSVELVVEQEKREKCARLSELGFVQKAKEVQRIRINTNAYSDIVEEIDHYQMLAE